MHAQPNLGVSKSLNEMAKAALKRCYVIVRRLFGQCIKNSQPRFMTLMQLAGQSSILLQCSVETIHMARCKCVNLLNLLSPKIEA